LSQILVHQVVGYDPTTEQLVFEVDIPNESWGAVKSILRDDEGDPDYVYIHKIDYSQAADILGLVHQTGPRNVDYYIECSAEAS
jgi:hypothetical protein